MGWRTLWEGEDSLTSLLAAQENSFLGREDAVASEWGNSGIPQL